MQQLLEVEITRGEDGDIQDTQATARYIAMENSQSLCAELRMFFSR